eukprot:scaffold58852_cov16-Prasinocladus_malaysianus.AAC.1
MRSVAESCNSVITASPARLRSSGDMRDSVLLVTINICWVINTERISNPSCSNLPGFITLQL